MYVVEIDSRDLLVQAFAFFGVSCLFMPVFALHFLQNVMEIKSSGQQHVFLAVGCRQL